MGRRIAILYHASEAGLDHRGYAVSRYTPVWQADGHEVVEVYGTETFVPADIVIVHVDLSEVPEAYLALAARYPAAVNGRVRSIRKTSFSPYLLRREDPWPGPVIVKSDRNFGGCPEAFKGIPRLDGTGTAPPFRSPQHYQVLPGLGDVPDTVWASPDFVVQRFIPELEDGLFHIRSYQFLGSSSDCVRLASPEPIVKLDSRVSSVPVAPHPAIVAQREALGFDFGKFDYVVVDGEAILLDVNKTIGGPSRGHRTGANPRRDARARGLYALFPGA